MSSFTLEGVRIEIDPETLRERVADPERLARWCAAHPEDPRTVSGLRMLERLEDAAEAGRASIRDADGHPVARALRRARLAQVLQWQGRFEEADAEFARAAEETGLSDDPTAPSSILALASVLQHRAKSRFEHSLVARAGERPRRARELAESAVEDARRALMIRTHLSAPADQVTSSRETLTRLERELEVD